MKLLIVTQRVDRTDSILGFFHGWITAFAVRLTALMVIGQQTGTHNLSENVRLHTLGKESGVSRLMQIVQFWKIIIVQRRDYDAVFIHMTPVWVLLGWPVWVLLRKPVYLWYEARGGGWVLPIALLLSRKVFGATDYGLPRRSQRRVIVGHGIDTELFRPASTLQGEGLLVAVGRVTPVKHYDLLIQTLAVLPQHCRLQIAGGTFTRQDERELQKLICLQHELGVSARVSMGWKSHDEVRDLLQHADCMLHACSGGLDKCVLEAMACGVPVISTSEAARRVLPMTCCARPEEFADRVRWVLGLSAQERSELGSDLRQRVVNGHSLVHLVDRLVSEMRS